MNNTIAGQYRPGMSFAHRIDPRFKLTCNLALIIFAFLIDEILLQLFFLIPVAMLYVQANMGFKALLKNLKTVIILGVFILMMNMVIFAPSNKSLIDDRWIINGGTKEGKAIYNWWLFNLSFYSIMKTILICLRILIMILATSILTVTTKPTGITKAIEDLLSPLKLLRIPVSIIAMIMTISLRFIPTLLNEAQRIMKAQASRGVDFKNGTIRSKTKAMVTLIIPLFVSAFSKAEDLGNAMETRGYNPYEKRTRYKTYPLSWRDLIVFFIFSGWIIILVFYNLDILPGFFLNPH